MRQSREMQGEKSSTSSSSMTTKLHSRANATRPVRNLRGTIFSLTLDGKSSVFGNRPISALVELSFFLPAADTKAGIVVNL